MRSGAPSALVKVTAPSMNVPCGVFSFAHEANSAFGVTVTVTVALEAAGTVTESAEKIRSMPAPAQFVELARKSKSITFSERAWPPRV